MNQDHRDNTSGYTQAELDALTADLDAIAELDALKAEIDALIKRHEGDVARR